MSELDASRTPYRIDVRWTPMQELSVSIQAYTAKADRATMDFGAAWAREVRHQISPDLSEQVLGRCNFAIGLVGMLTMQSDAPEAVEPFAAWMANMSVGEIYERDAALRAGETVELPVNLAQVRDDAVRLVRDWNEQYFAGIDPAILSGLAVEAARLRASLPAACPIDLVEQTTGGVRFMPSKPVDVVLLIPQYHYRPWNIYARFGAMQLFRYAADVVPTGPGEPPIDLLRVTRALGDESRLRILHYLGEGTRSFTDLVRFMGLSKSTVHHHLVTLRAAGLVRLEDHDEKSRMYSLRPGITENIAARLNRYLTQE